MRLSVYVVFSGFFLLLAAAAPAYTVPQKVPVQGRLSNASTGVVLSGEYNFTFRIYNASTGGTLLWDENQTLTVDGNGLWNALLGNNTTLSLNFSEDTYLEVELNHDGNPLPRVQLGSTPYAEWTDTAANLSCTDCLGTTEIEDVYLLNTGDNATGDYMFNGSFKIENSTGSSLLFVNSSNGYVGIGTSSPNTKLEVNGDISTGSSSHTVLLNPIVSVYRDDVNVYGATLGYANSRYRYRLVNPSAADFVIASEASSSYPTHHDNFTEHIIVRGDTGYVGIGTTSPNYGLHLNGTGSSYFQITSNTSGGTTNDGFILGIGTDNDAVILQREEATMRFYTNNTERIRITSSGYVGIGTTSPDALFTVQGYSGGTVGSAVSNYTKTMIIGGDYNQQYNSGNATLLLISDYSNDAGDDIYPIYVEDENNGVDFYVRNNASAVGGSRSAYFGGNVGIGTTSPEAKLHISGTSGYRLQLDRDYSGTNKGWRAQITHSGTSDEGKIVWDAIHSTSDWQIRDSSQNTLWYLDTSSGNVGIGTTAPNGKLDIRNSTNPSIFLSATNVHATQAVGAIYAGYPDSGGWGNTYYRIAMNNGSGGYSDKFTIRGNGNVGIGTTSPDRPLHIKDDGPYVLFEESDQSNKEWMIGLSGQDLIFLEDATTIRALFEIGGNVGIGTTDPNDALDVVGDIDATGCVQTDDSGSIGGTCISDFRFKTNIRALEGSLDRISQLNPVSFEWDPEHYAISSEEGRGVGLIAQELEEVYPELVVTDVDGYKRVRYDIELEMHLIQAVKELKEENEDLKRAVCKIDPEAAFCAGL